MRIKFKNTAYTAIGFNSTFTGMFIKSGDVFIESDNGTKMTIKLPNKFTTSGRELVSIK